MNPVSTVVIMYGIGLVLGCVVGYLIGYRQGEQDHDE